MQQKNVLEYIERTVNEVPEKIAYESFEGDGCRMTFREVYNTARSIGTYLADNGFYAQPVIIFMKKTPRIMGQPHDLSLTNEMMITFRDGKEPLGYRYAE